MILVRRVKSWLQERAVFWIVGKWLREKVDFPFFSRLYKLRRSIREHKMGSRVFFGSLPSVFKYILSAVVFILATQWLSAVVHWELPAEEADDYVGLLVSTIVTVGGVFLGLYFAALSAVAGGLFMRAPGDLQDVFIKERRGAQYVKIIALTTLVGIFYLFLRAVAYELSPVGPFVLALLSAYSVVRFLSLGTQTFYFIHPTDACNSLTADCAAAITGASVSGFGWNKDYLQNHNKERAEKTLSTLSSLVSFGDEALKLSDEQMTVIARAVGGLLVFYLEKKKQIPTDSFWYRKKMQHKNWILTDVTELALSLNTGRGLNPNNIKDHLWFEEECVDIIFKLFDVFATKKRWGAVQVCIEVLGQVNEKAGAELYDDLAKLVAARMDKAITTILNATHEETDDRIGQMAVIDSVGRLGISTALGLVLYLVDHPKEIVESEILGIDFRSRKSLYLSRFLGRELPQLEDTVDRLNTEAAIEGTVVSPPWYLLTITGQRYLFAIKSYVEFVQTFCSDYYKKYSDLLVEHERNDESAILIERWLEFAFKLDLLVRDFKKLFEHAAEFKKVTDLPWPEVDFGKLKSFAEDCEKNAVNALTGLIPKLVGRTFDPSLPDHFGQALTFGVQGCYEAARDNDLARLKKIFPSIFIASLAAYDSTVKQTQGWQPDSQITFSSEPLEDVLTLSGYIKLYSELHQNPELWSVCQTVWTGYLTASPEPKNFIELVVYLIRRRDGIFAIKPKAMLRANWDMTFRGKLEELGLVSDSAERFFGSRNENIAHPSPIIRVFGRDVMVASTDVRNLFLVTHLLKESAAQGIEFPDRRDIERQIQQAIDEYESDSE